MATPTSYPDRLAAVVRKCGPLCVGYDPRYEWLPRQFQSEFQHLTPAERVSWAIFKFGKRVLELVRPHAGIVKFQAACFEQYGSGGMWAMERLLARAREQGFFVIVDGKRNDIASTAQAYARAAFRGYEFEGQPQPGWEADAITVNPLLGTDAVEPFLHEAALADGGLFILVRTSNPGAGQFQDLDCGGKPLYRHIAEAVVGWNADSIAGCGLGRVGAVVGATKPAELKELRELMPNNWFLVPGYGAQGATAQDVRAAFRADGLGALVNSSRGVVFPFAPDDADWEQRITSAAAKATAELKG